MLRCPDIQSIVLPSVAMSNQKQDPSIGIRWDEVKKDFAQLLGALMHKHILSTEELAIRLGLSESVIRQLHNANYPYPGPLRKLVKIHSAKPEEAPFYFKQGMDHAFALEAIDFLKLKDFVAYIFEGNNERLNIPLRPITTTIVSTRVSTLPRIEADQPKLTQHFRSRTNTTHPKIAICMADFAHVGLIKDVEAEKSRADDIRNCLFEALDAALQEALDALHDRSEFVLHVKASATPTLKTTSGMGAMIIWEYPTISRQIELGLDLFLIDYAAYAQSYLYKSLNAFHGYLGFPWLKQLHPRIVLTKGPGLKHLGSNGWVLSYESRKIDEAKRLQKLVQRPGVIIQAEFAPDLLMERFCFDQNSSVTQINFAKDVNNSLVNNPQVWMKLQADSKDGDGNRINRIGWRLPWSNLKAAPNIGEVKKLFECPYDLESLEWEMKFSEHDIVSLFEVRARIEAQFAGEAASAAANPSSFANGMLNDINASVTKMEEMAKTGSEAKAIRDKAWRALGDQFHCGIARLSDQHQGEKRADVVNLAYISTQRVCGAVEDRIPPVEVARQHRRIFEAIRRGKAKEATSEMEEHISAHYRIAREELFKQSIDVAPGAACFLQDCPLLTSLTDQNNNLCKI